jgi:hypothetical protein
LASTATSTLLSAGPVLFAPDVRDDGTAVLFAADVSRATVFAFELPSEEASSGTADVHVENLATKVASLLGVDSQDAVIRGIAVHPVSHAVYLSVARGRGADAGPVIVRADTNGDLSVVEVDDLPSTSFALDDAPADDDERKDAWLDGSDESSAPREIHGVTLNIAQVPAARSAITDLAWVDGTLFIAGLSNEEFSSRLRQVQYPFGEKATETSVEIFHVDHGKYETHSPIRALASFDGGKGILASYTCTPVVHFALADAEPGTKVVGRTVAELGAMNQPLDMVSCTIGGEEHVLVANSAHGLIKIATRDIDDQPALTEPKEPIGVPREVEDLQGIVKLENLDDTHVLALQVDDDGGKHLRSLKTASL